MIWDMIEEIWEDFDTRDSDPDVWPVQEGLDGLISDDALRLKKLRYMDFEGKTPMEQAKAMGMFICGLRVGNEIAKRMAMEPDVKEMH